MPVFPIQGANAGTWGTGYSDFFSPIFDLNTGAFNISQSLLLSLDGSLDLGAPTKRFQNGYLSGVMTAGSYLGNGSGLTGIASGTGGVINTGSTTIGADSNSNGVGEIALQIKSASKMIIDNDGKISRFPPMKVAIALENASATNSFFLTNYGASGFSRVNFGDALYVEEAGNVGIKVSAPVSGLTIDDINGIYQRHSSGGRIVFDDTDVADGSSPMAYVLGVDGGIIIGRADRSASTGRTTNSQDSVTITASGDLGVGVIPFASKLAVAGLPTSSAGLNAGDIWNNSGVLNII